MMFSIRLSALPIITVISAVVNPLPAQSVSNATGRIGHQDAIPGRSVLAEFQNEQPAFMVRAELDRPSRSYREGDQVSLKVVTEAQAYIYVYYQQADGQRFLIFPNSHQPNHLLAARQVVSIPANDDLFRWQVGPPFGNEVITVIASRKPLEGRDPHGPLQQLFTPVSEQQTKGMEVVLAAAPPVETAKFDLPLTTYAKGSLTSPPGSKRFGVFFGVSEYAFDAEREEKGTRSLQLPTCQRDARVLAKLMSEVGRLDDFRIYTNRQVTRDRIQESITQWLPAKSRPGDTVFLFFSGHGAQFPDREGDERDGFDEALIPYEAADAGVWDVLIDKHQSGRLTPDQLQWYAKFQTIATSASSIRDLNEKLVRATSISDDLLGHWLQWLDGRQVVVILDVCHAGGFSELEKGVHRPTRFDFLDSEITRLKDIGQNDAALFASSSVDDTSTIREDHFPANHGPLSVMSSYVADVLLSAQSPISLEHAQRHCFDGMQRYFQIEGNRHAHQPYLFVESLSKPIFLRP